jgi:hypothetical protein
MAPRPTEIDLVQVERLKRSGMTWADIGRRLNVDPAWIHRLRKRAAAAVQPAQPAQEGPLAAPTGGGNR